MNRQAESQISAKKRYGFVLLVVLGLLSVFVFINILFVQVSQTTRKLSKNYFLEVKAEQLLMSGFDFIVEKYQEDYLYFNAPQPPLPVGDGTLVAQGDTVALSARDANGRINVNDGDIVAAGDEVFTFDPYGGQQYDSPYKPDQKGLHNLRLRRLLNAYGDVHRFIDKVYDTDQDNVGDPGYYGRPLPEPVFSIDESSSSDGRRGQPMSYIIYDYGYPTAIDIDSNMGLGDQILYYRPAGGYQTWDRVKEIVDAWARHSRINLSDKYLDSHNGSFFDMVKDDLTLSSFKDDRFSTLIDETEFGFFDLELLGSDYQKGDFLPYPISTFQENGSFSFSKNFYAGYESRWNNQDPVALVNLNQTSFFVRAAVFYAPTNVSYHVEGASTFPPYLMRDPNHPDEYLTANTGIEAMIPIPTIGVMPPVFYQGFEKMENGHAGKGRQTHLMSLRDAMQLALAYEKHTKDQKIPIRNFDEFKTFLEIHERGEILNNSLPPYERVLPLNDEKGNSTYPLGADNKDINFGGLFHVAPYESRGVFLMDYVSKTLPHILSCVRRMPSYLGAPAALQSPYLVLKPNQVNQDTLDGWLCRQGFCKIEDFVWRTPHPKVCFLPHGQTQLKVEARISGGDSGVVIARTLTAEAEFFETKYFRTQEDFTTITDRSTDSDIKIGPHYFLTDWQGVTFDSAQYLGCVGLKDFQSDLGPQSLDTFMTRGDNKWGYQPQLVMDFVPTEDDGNPDNGDQSLRGFENTSPFPLSPDPIDDFNTNPIYVREKDFWANEFTDGAYPDPNDYDEFYAHIGQRGDHETGVSAFNGALLSAISHGEVFVNPIDSDDQPFAEALYWRLDEWLKAYPGKPVGYAFARGVMTFWFRVPSDYDYTTPVRTPHGYVIQSENFSRVMAHLTLWEKYKHREAFPNIVLRPVSLTLGIKKTKRLGLNVFFRYDAGLEHHDGSLLYSYTAPDEFGVEQLISSPYAPSSYQDDFLGFWCSASNPSFTEPREMSYENYRWQAHRSSEVSVPLANIPENGPGTWHRLSAFWNLGWDESSGMFSSKQLSLDLHDTSNKKFQVEREYHQGVVNAPAWHNFLLDHYDYPHDDTDQISEGSNVGFIFPYDSTMIFSLGDVHRRSLGSFTTRYKLYYVYQYYPVMGRLFDLSSSTETGVYYPSWRFNSCLDNFRLWMGPKDADIPNEYFDPNFVSDNAKSNPYAALRYHVTHETHSDFDSTHEPKWIINPDIPKNSQLRSIGARVYYPPDSADPPNTSYVFLSANHFDEPTQVLTEISPDAISTNEQNLFYAKTIVDDDFRIILQYTAFKPTLDGDQSNRRDYPLVYRETDHFTNIPWIQEVSIRYAPKDSVKVANYEID